ncbi:hypothetical protein ACJJTC_009195 [Scirpophaga incertulas]
MNQEPRPQREKRKLEHDSSTVMQPTRKIPIVEIPIEAPPLRDADEAVREEKRGQKLNQKTNRTRHAFQEPVPVQRNAGQHLERSRQKPKNDRDAAIPETRPKRKSQT